MDSILALREQVCAINLALKASGLVTQTWGNASAVDREQGIVAIKPSGISYKELKPEHIVVVDMTGKVAASNLRPSVDLPSHLALYNAFSRIGGVIHTHSHYATCFAQARREIPCFGTTHADYFHGNVPLISHPNKEEVHKNYEHFTGQCIVRYFENKDPITCPAALIAGHGPFAWGETLQQAFENAEVLEELARMAVHTLAINNTTPPLEDYLLEKHFNRKHGRNAYYGQQELPAE